MQGIIKIYLNVFYFMLKVNFPWAMYYTEVQRVSSSRIITFKDTARFKRLFFYLYLLHLKKSRTAVTRWFFTSTPSSQLNLITNK